MFFHVSSSVLPSTWRPNFWHYENIFKNLWYHSGDALSTNTNLGFISLWLGDLGHVAWPICKVSKELWREIKWMYWREYSTLSNCQFNLNAKRVSQREGERWRGWIGGRGWYYFLCISSLCHLLIQNCLASTSSGLTYQLLARTLESVKSYEITTFHLLHDLGHIIGVSKPCLLHCG